MILKNHTSANSIFVASITSLFVIFIIINFLNFRIILEDIRENIHSYELGISRLTSWDESQSLSNKVHQAIKKTPSIFYNKIFYNKNQDFEEFFINVDFKNYKQILEDRAKAIELGLLENPSDVNAIINFKGEAFQAKIRLKGDLRDHWLSQHRMSFRVKLKNNKTIFGLNEFSIQKPRSRMFPYDAVFQKLARNIGILASKHQYARVNFNGNTWGIMDIESHVSKEFVESEQRKESIIVRFSNEDGWKYLRTSANPDFNYRISSPEIYSKLYSAKDKLKDELNRLRYSYIVNQRLKGAPELYSFQSYLDMLLLSDVWGTDHALYANNLKHYFNPYTLKLEAISSDQVEPREYDFTGCSERFVFTSSKTFGDINKADLSQFNLDQSINLITKTVSENKDNFFNSEQAFFPLDEIAPTSLIKEKSDLLSLTSIQPYIDRAICVNNKTFKKVSDSLNYPAHVYAHQYSNGVVEIFNLLNEEVEVLFIQDSSGDIHPVNLTIPGYLPNDFNPISIETEYIGNYDSRLSIVTSHNDQERKTPFKITLTSKDVNNPLIAETPKSLEFLSTNDNKDWFIKKGVWNINSPIVINGNLTIEEGTTLKFGDKSYLIVKGYLLSVATENKKTIFTSLNDSWQGLYIFNSSKESVLKNTSISNVSSIKDGMLKLTGGVTFYNADVRMENVNFSYGFDEDLLNIVNSKYSLNHIVVKHADSDAIDFDFSEGVIDNIELSNIEGDALDFSGGSSKVSNANIFNVKDKAISAGEEVYLDVKNSKIKNVGIGVASKDGSKVHLSKSSIKDTALSPAMSYIKKNFYDFPEIIIESTEIDHNKIIAQTGTKFILNNTIIETQNIDVEKMYSSGLVQK